MVSAVIFDLDGTLTRTPNPWQHIHQCLGVWDNRASEHFGEWISGKVSYDEFCRKDVGLWEGRRLQEIHGYLDGIELNRHVPQVALELERRSIPSIIISSGFTHVAERVQSETRWQKLLVYANELAEGPRVHVRVSADWSSALSKKARAGEALRLVGARESGTLVVSDALRDLQQLSDCAHHLHVREEDDLLRTLDYLK
jgi:phosphoserine phosphatase